MKMNRKEIEFAIELINNKALNEQMILTCGNGGSAHTSSHYITDWNKSFNLLNNKKFKGLSLSHNHGIITAIANDITYEDAFSQQIESIGSRDDLLIVVSGSGNSRNILKAIETAKKVGMTSLGFLGYDGGQCLELCDHFIHVPSFDMQICEDIHLIIGHIIMKGLCNVKIVK